MSLNLTEPPHVDEPSARRLDELRSALVAYATEGVQPNHRRTWVPVVAAVGAVAAVAVAAVVVPRLTGSDARPPVASSGPTHEVTEPTADPVLPRIKPPVKVPAPAVSLDLGPATETEARAMLERCFNGPPGGDFTPADAATATIRLARWAVQPDDGRNGEPDPTPGRQLVVTAVRADGKAVTNCVDSNGVASSITGSAGGSTYGSSPQMPISGGGTTSDNAENGHWVLRGSSPFDVVAGVARVDMRLTWRGGAGPWQSAVLVGRTGFADIAATGPGAKRVDAKTEVRLVDAEGYLLFHAVTGLGSPVGVR